MRTSSPAPADTQRQGPARREHQGEPEHFREPDLAQLEAERAAKRPGAKRVVDARVRIDRLQLLYGLSFPAVFFSVTAACMLAAILWGHTQPGRMAIWLAALFGASTVRAALFIGYRRVRPVGEAILAWEKPYVATLMVSALAWGAGALWVMPADSPLHQAITGFFLMGVAGSALSVYSAIRPMALATILATLAPFTAWLFLRGDSTSMYMGLAACLFFVSALRTTRTLSATMQQNFEMNYALAQAKEAAEKMAGTDALTGLPNRRAFADQAKGLMSYCRRHQRPVSALLIDIDHFKRINDTRGHAVGDIALRHLAHLLQSGVRGSDVCCRLGGEEFAVLLPDTTLEAGCALAEKLRAAIADHPVPLQDDTLYLTASLGVASGNGDLEALLDTADAAMYEAKQAGRDRVMAKTWQLAG